MKKPIIFLFVLFSVLSFSQEKKIAFQEREKIKEDSIVQSIQDELKLKGTEEYFYFKELFGYTNIIVTDDDDNFEEHFDLESFNQYFIWKENNHFYIKKLERKTIQLFIYKELQIDGKTLFKFINKNISEIQNEKANFKPYEYLDEDNNKNLREKIPTSCAIFNFNNYELISFETMWVETLKHNRNINYKHNQSLKIVQLYNKCQKIISKLEEKNLFVKQE